jgi:hypothetical protein
MQNTATAHLNASFRDMTTLSIAPNRPALIVENSKAMANI